MKQFFKDFKAFISRGNILDMAVGVIIGSAFSAIVTALTNKIIMPLINLVLSLGGENGLSSAYTFLKKVYDTEGLIDLDNSIYIDWGAFITAILNFLIIAFTLFLILRVAMKSSQFFKRSTADFKKSQLTKEDKKALKEKGISLKDKEAVKAYRLEKARIEEENKKLEAEKQAQLEAQKKLENPSEQELLKEIRDLLKTQVVVENTNNTTIETKNED